MKLLTTEEAAQYLADKGLAITPTTLANWRAIPGKGPAYRKLGGAVRYTPAALDEFLFGRTQDVLEAENG